MNKLLIAVLLIMSSIIVNGKNYQINGSFEFASNPDIPDYWTPVGRSARSALGIPPEFMDKDKVNDLMNKFVIDTDTSVHGNKSIRTEAPFFVGSILCDVEPKHDYTVSVYLKSSRPNMTVEFAVVNNDRQKPYRKKQLEVSTEWVRYELNLPEYPHGKISVLITPIDSGKLWVDAVQIENGLKTTDFAPSGFDTGFTRPQAKIHIGTGKDKAPPVAFLGKALAIPPLIDGVLDECWKNSPVLTMNTIMGAPSETPIKIRAAYDQEYIYVFFECSDPLNNNGAGESMEIFLDILGTGSPYYQFIFTHGGKKSNFRVTEGRHEWNWQADWQLAVRNGERAWTAEAAIPFKLFPEFSAMAAPDKIKMNFVRNYPAGPEVYLSWAPVNITFLEPERFGTVYLAGKAYEKISLADVKFISTNAADYKFAAGFTLANNTPHDQSCLIIANLETATNALQSKTMRIKIPARQKSEINIPDFNISDNRGRLGLSVLDENGKTLAQWRDYRDTPHELKIFTEYSYYTNEKNARLSVNHNNLFSAAKLVMTAVLEPLATVLDKHEYSFEPDRRLYNFPLNKLGKAHNYTIKAQLLDHKGQIIAIAKCDLLKHAPNHTEVKINRINRGMYVNGKPYIPYGYQVWLLNEKQLQYYKSLGHDYICYTGHWGDLATNNKFLSVCEKLKLKVMNFYAVRSYAEAPGKMMELLRNNKSLVAAIPVDECVDYLVPRVITEAKCANPYLVTYRNDNIAAYRYWRQQPGGLFGDAFSIDRYPLLLLPKGMPQTPGMIYSFERVLEFMDEDGVRERKPVFIWMEAAEARSKEPTRDELVFLHYIAVVNHCMSFTYFGGIPLSRHVRATILELDKELKAIQPFLFSFEDEPVVGFDSEATRELVRILPKKLDDELLLICINRATEPVKAGIRLDNIPEAKGKNAAVMFENRSLQVGDDGVLTDEFAPFGRHVYKIKLK